MLTVKTLEVPYIDRNGNSYAWGVYMNDTFVSGGFVSQADAIAEAQRLAHRTAHLSKRGKLWELEIALGGDTRFVLHTYRTLESKKEARAIAAKHDAKPWNF